MSWSRVFISALACVCILNSGCSTDDPAASMADASGFVSEITESQTGASLRVEVDSTEIDLSGVISLTANLKWESGVRVELIVPDWKDAGWNDVREHRDEIRFDGQSYSQSMRFELDPFLGGVYEIPSIGMRASSEVAGRRIARLSPIEITVDSVLAEADSRDLDPAKGLADPMVVSGGPSSLWMIIGGTGVAVLCWTLLVWIRDRGSVVDGSGPEAQALLLAAAGSAELSDDDLGSLHRAMIELSREHMGMGPLSEEIARLRFSGSVVDHRRVRSTAQKALELCGGKGSHP